MPSTRATSGIAANISGSTWAAFEETGNVWDPETARRFAQYLLSTGNETDRAEAYRQFRGRDPDVNALLRKRGFPTGEPGEQRETRRPGERG